MLIKILPESTDTVRYLEVSGTIEVKRISSGVTSARIRSDAKEVLLVDSRWHVEIITDSGQLIDIITPRGDS